MSIHLVRQAILASAIACVSMTSIADAGVTPFLNISATGGGSTLFTANYKDGHSQRLNSGGLMDLAFGLDYRASERSMLTWEGNLGFHWDRATGSNGFVAFTRIPVEGLVFWNPNEQFRLGGGLRKSAQAKFKAGGVLDNYPDFNMSSSLGVVVQTDYFLMPQISLMARLVSERYKSPLLPGGSVNGSHIGLGVGFHF